MPPAARACLALLLVLCVASARVAYRAAPAPESWFAGLFHGTENRNSTAAIQHRRMCCHRLEFQEDLENEPVEAATVPFSYWWRNGHVLLSVAHSLDAPAENALRITPSGLAIDGHTYGEAFLRVQCAFACCLESVAFARPSAVQEQPPLAAGIVHFATGVRSDHADARHRTYSELQEQIALVSRVLYPESKNIDSREYLWVAPGEHERIDRQRVCVTDPASEGLYVHMVLPARAQYAISELDLCFVDMDAGLGWDLAYCEDEPV